MRKRPEKVTCILQGKNLASASQMNKLQSCENPTQRIVMKENNPRLILTLYMLIKPRTTNALPLKKLELRLYLF